MHRSNSLNRSLDEFAVDLDSSVILQSSSSSKMKKNYSAVDVDMLPRYNDERFKKPSRFRGENAIHLIPVILILCGVILWFAGTTQSQEYLFSLPENALLSKHLNKFVPANGLKNVQAKKGVQSLHVVDHVQEEAKGDENS